MSRKNTLMFSPIKVGPITIPNRFMRSATWEMLAKPDGCPTDDLTDLIKNYASAGVGLIVPGALVITKDRSGKLPLQCRIGTPFQAERWKNTVDFVHKHGSKIMFQFSRAGLNALNPISPSIIPGLTPPLCHELTNEEIENLIQLYINSTQLSVNIAGVDGVQIHACHGSLLSTFLSPLFNRRTDKWGDRNRLISEIITNVRSVLPKDKLLSIKMNGSDNKGALGILPENAAQTVSLLSKNVDLFEISCGLNPGHTTRSNLDEKGFIRSIKRVIKSKEEQQIELEKVRKIYKGHKYFDSYTAGMCRTIKKMNPHVHLASVGGWRSFDSMEKFIKEGVVDLISISRPFLRDPYLVRRFQAGTIDEVTCKSCGLCLSDFHSGVYCHQKSD